jgi:lysophospholipase L1-like esterase
MDSEHNAFFPITADSIYLSPYTWKCFDMDGSPRAQAAMPGAYVKTVVQATTNSALLIDGTANAGCPAASMPVIEYSVDSGPFQIAQLSATGEVNALPLAAGLDPGSPHRVEVFFRAADLTQRRWEASTAHLRLAGITLDAGGSLIRPVLRAKRAIGFGDSITEGVGVDGYFSSWQALEVNNARATWLPLVCTALGCEYGQLGSGGQGMVRPIEMPPLPQAWDHYDAAALRLVAGRLLPEPDYVFCCMGTNDFTGDVHDFSAIDITTAYVHWLTAVRAACPLASIFCVVPPLGWHAEEIAAAVKVRQVAGDDRVHLIDTSPLHAAFALRPTQLAHDGVHPTVYGQAMLGALIAAQVQRALDSHSE